VIPITRSSVKLVGVAGWRLVLSEPRHNTFHNALAMNASQNQVGIKYLGLEENPPLDWLTKFWPNTILRKFPSFSFSDFANSRKLMQDSPNEPTVVFLFEGSLSWYFLLSIYTLFNRNITVVCNLFSSSKYKNLLFNSGDGVKTRFKILFYFFSKFPRSIATFDTQQMADLVNTNVRSMQFYKFPVTSSFPFREELKKESEHFHVLVNLRTFPLDRLHRLMQNSCPKCIFRFPRGPMATPSLESEFSKYDNAQFDRLNIPVEDYMGYFDQFDYTILLYQPSIDASGKLLDAIARRLPVVIPEESTEWAAIARKWGTSSTFKWDTVGIVDFKPFNHPDFVHPLKSGAPDFTPEDTLRCLQEFHFVNDSSNQTSIPTRVLGYFLLGSYNIFAFILNSFSAVNSRIRKNI